MTTSLPLARIADGSRLPDRATDGSFGYDISTLESCEISARETTIVHTGLKLAADLPTSVDEGVAMLILPRSSLPLRHGLILPNSPGLIDADYGGEIGVIVHNLRDEPVRLEAGTRIAQAVFVKVLLPSIVSADEDPDRTRGGFGSTGRA